MKIGPCALAERKTGPVLCPRGKLGPVLCPREKLGPLLFRPVRRKTGACTLSERKMGPVVLSERKSGPWTRETSVGEAHLACMFKTKRNTIKHNTIASLFQQQKTLICPCVSLFTTVSIRVSILVLVNVFAKDCVYI